VAIVGARCAGSPLATMLARRGLRVCLLDKSRFPSETLSTHVIQPCGVAILERLGVLDAAWAAGAMPLTRFTLVSGRARISAAIDPSAFGAPALCLRRIALDHLLVEAAAAAGAEVRTETPVGGLLWEGNRVVGVETAAGPIRARLVVGADGRGSTVAKSVGAAEYYVAPPARMFAWAYFEGATETEGHLRLGSVGDLNYVAGPTDGGLYMAAVCPPLARKDAFLADRERGFMAGIAAWAELAGLLDGATRTGPIRVMANWRGYFREAAGPGWALLGDAGTFKDPSPAQGIADALRQAEHLAAAVEAGLGGAASIDEELRRWWHWRDEDGYEMHWFATDMGRAGPSPPLASQFTRDIAGDDVATEGLLRVLNHDIPPSRLFTPRRLGRAAVRAVRANPGQTRAIAREAAMELQNEIRRSRERHRRRRALRLPA
jgi:menaquinone-9 beta-reductase